MTNDAAIVAAGARLVRLPVDPRRGDAIQKFDALELPIVDITDRAGQRGIGFGYTIGRGGTAMLSLLQDELLHQLIGTDSRHIVQIMERLRKSIHALTPGCVTTSSRRARQSPPRRELPAHAPRALARGGRRGRHRPIHRVRANGY